MGNGRAGRLRWSRMGVAGSNGRNGSSGDAKRRGRSSSSLASSAPKMTVNGKRTSVGIVVDKPLKFTIPSNFIAGRDVQKRILDDVSRVGFNSQCQFAIKLALEEALINAIKHGNA